MRLTLVPCLFLLSGLTACTSDAPWADWDKDHTSGANGAVASTQTGYRDYTPRPAIESAPLDAAPAGTPMTPPGAQASAAAPAYGDTPYGSAPATQTGAGAPVPLHAGPFAVAAAPPAPYTGKPIAQRTLPLALTGTGVAR